MTLIKMAEELDSNVSIDLVRIFMQALQETRPELYDNINWILEWNMMTWSEIADYLQKNEKRG